MSAKGNSSPSGPGSPSSPPLGPDQTFIERDEPRPELPGETVVEGASSGASSGLGASLREFKGWRVVQGFPARGAEADIFLLEKERQQRILKLYRLGIRPKEEVFPKLQSVTQESPELFVQVYEQGLDPQTRRFFEMQEFFPLGTLKSLMESNRSKEEQVLALLKQASVFLEKLHFRGILHLDLKPANILLRSKDPLRIAVTDFGIASLLGEEYSKKMTDVKGTSLYQSPESLSGIVGPKSDWWSLGMIALEWLAGKHPFEGLQRQAIFYRLTTGDIRPDDSIAGEWRGLIRGLLTRNPDQRWGHEEVSQWLERQANASGEQANLQPSGGPSHLKEDKKLLSVPFVFAARSFSSLENLLEWVAFSPEAWAKIAPFLADGSLMKWLERAGDYERAEQVFKILGKGDPVDIGLFRLIRFFRSDLAPSWAGEPLNSGFFERLFQRVASTDSEGNDALFLERFFSGFIKKAIEVEQGGLVPGTERIFSLAESLMKNSMAGLPLPKRSLIMLAAITEAFTRRSVTAQARKMVAKEKDVELLFRIAATPGFLDWARAEGVVDEPSTVLWRFLVDCVKDGFHVLTARLFENLRGREEPLIAALVTRPGFHERLSAFVRGGEVVEEVFQFFVQNRRDVPWLEDFFLERFRLKPGPEFDKFCRRYLLYLRLKANEAVFRERLLPPILKSAFEAGGTLMMGTKVLREFLSSHPFEQVEELIANPSLLPKKGVLGITDWHGVKTVLEQKVTLPFDEPDVKIVKSVTALLNDEEFIASTNRESIFQRSPDEIWAWAGLALGGILGVTGLAVVPGVLAFFGAVWVCGRDRRRLVLEAGARIETIKKSASGAGGPSLKRGKKA